MLLLLLFLQDIETLDPWENLASPWLTPIEVILWQQASDLTRAQIQGQFIAKRMPPETVHTWPKTGLFLPQFYWVQNGLLRKTQLQPEPISIQDPQFKELRNSLIQNTSPYEIGPTYLGVPRIPPDLEFRPGAIQVLARKWHELGQEITISVNRPTTWQNLTQTDFERTVECHAVLSQGKESVVRHQSIKLTDQNKFHFSIKIPTGIFEADFYIFCGSINQGILAKKTLVVPLAGTMSSPMLAQSSEKNTMAAKGPFDEIIGGIRWNTKDYNPQFPATVLIQGASHGMQLWLINGQNQLFRIPIKLENNWAQGEIQPQKNGFRLLAINPQKKDVQWSDFLGYEQKKTGDLDLPKSSNLTWETISSPNNGVNFWAVEGQPWLVSDQSITDWSPQIIATGKQLQNLFLDGKSLTYLEGTLAHERLTTNVRSKPRHISVNFRNRSGELEAPTDIQINGSSRIAKAILTPKTWGVVIEDQMFQHEKWSQIREHTLHFLKDHVKPQDSIYLVIIQERAVTWLEPTQEKVRFLALWQNLSSNIPDQKTYLDMRFIMEGLTTFPIHSNQPHHVLMLSPGMVDDLTHWRDIALEASDLGLHLHELSFEFPIETKPDLSTQEKMADTVVVKDGHENLVHGDDFQETRNVQAGFRFRFGTKKAEKLAREKALREEASRESLSQQLAISTAGTQEQIPRMGTFNLNLEKAFLQLGQWIESMRFIKLEKDLEASQIQWGLPDGVIPYWTMVSWQIH